MPGSALRRKRKLHRNLFAGGSALPFQRDRFWRHRARPVSAWPGDSQADAGHIYWLASITLVFPISEPLTAPLTGPFGSAAVLRYLQAPDTAASVGKPSCPWDYWSVGSLFLLPRRKGGAADALALWLAGAATGSASVSFPALSVAAVKPPAAAAGAAAGTTGGCG